MRAILIIGVILLSAARLQAQDKSYVKKGNDLYQQKKYTEAAELYTKAVEKKKESVEGQFNLGDAFYKQKKYDKAAEQFSKIAESNKDKTTTARAYHNLGNTLLESKKLEESVAAYKKALLNDPKDEETRYNLVYAMDQLKKQNKGKDGKNKDEKKDKNKKDQDKKDQNKDDKDKKDQDKKDDKSQQQQPQPQPDKISKEDAQRMLDALNNQEKQTQEKLKGKKAKGVAGKPLKDW
ncbi:tetratricopeptide repeat protein [Mucilaginibacter antarcticus]|uniref:Tetratricopeptide repeat protein n=1 Tax=Mucilaginibacter antarcticus TaxID=1855725 RepID=A0ABW5XQK0_9SPHI